MKKKRKIRKVEKKSNFDIKKFAKKKKKTKKKVRKKKTKNHCGLLL
jgi:hypothetical protein